ncbi:MAG: aspartate-semialdehyde dehydrogenase [Candidatus Harrisonbacteria bacterium]|nr:aspartate-semialdehyde dehydrogenase [Candidatus Harrisonbacteria bacterium]
MKKRELKVNSKRLNVGILGATGMVGQRFVTLLENHPWFEVVSLAASPQSAGKTYEEAVSGRWVMKNSVPEKLRGLKIKVVEEDFDEIVKEVDLVFSAIDADKEKIKEIELRYATAGVAVVSNNSAHRWTQDVPMIIPEINAHHLSLIDIQKKNRGWEKGLLVVKPNCSLQSYLPVVYALKKFGPKEVLVTTLQAISGAGKTFESWPEMLDNCIPFIKGEEEKTEKEPTKIWGAGCPAISATCIRVPISDGHMASVSVKFENKPSLQQIRDAIDSFPNPLASLDLPSAPKKFIKYFLEDDRPQTKLDRDYEGGLGITCGRFREDGNNSWKFVSLSHNTIRGAAGGAILIAELLYKKGYLK